ncbi:MAG: oxidoreductase family protein, partial [Verrucomicrobiota bacterium]
WLANFHATFLGVEPLGLWETGTYWHLETRPDEFAALDHQLWIEAAPLLDRRLREARYQTFVHGDAKLANFCFSPDLQSVAAVDFQYVGGGCGMRDLAYFVGSCLTEDECAEAESSILELYFAELRSCLAAKNRTVEINNLEEEWRTLYPIAWADFHRFLLGWSPGHWKLHHYSESIARRAIESLS